MDTIVAPITPLIPSAVIVVRISGENLERLLPFFSIDRFVPRKATFCRYIGSEISDDILLTFFKAPFSYTGEDVLEVSFHGNPIIVSSFIKDLYSLGVRYAMPGEFTKRAFLNGKIDLSQAEAVAEIINSKSKYSVQFSYGLLSGGLTKRIDEIISTLIDIGSVIEAFIEFPEEDLDIESLNGIFTKVDSILDAVNNLTKHYDILNNFKDGFTVVIAGKPNVGKSSLLNFLISHERSIVSDIPGTTRDYITEYADLEGIPIKLIDTAGIRISSDRIEALGIEKAKQLIDNADLVIALFDASSFDEDDRYLLEYTSNKNRVLFLNKKDLLTDYPIDYDLSFSLKYSMDLDKIIPFLKDRLLPKESDKLGLDVMINDRHRYLFNNFIVHLNKIKEALKIGDLDIAAFELSESLNILYEITGEHYTEDILNNIFDRFCIGK